MRRAFASEFWMKANIALWLGISAIIFRGYVFGMDDQAEQLPAVLRVLDSHYLPRDWFVNSTQGWGPRTFYSHFVAAFARFLGVEAAFALLHFLCWGFAGWGLARLIAGLLPSSEATRSRFLAGVLCAWFVIIWSVVVTGANAWLSRQLIPSEVANTIGIWAIVLWLEGRRWTGAALVLLAGTIHPLIGPLGGLVLACTSWWDERARVSSEERKTKAHHSEWLSLALATLLPLIAGYLGDRSGTFLTASQKHEALYILAFERHPWHYVPWTWSGETWSVWGLLLALGVWARREAGIVRILDTFAFVSLAFTVLGWISIWWQPLWPLAKLQPFRMTIWLELASFAYLSIFLGRRLVSTDSAQRLSVMAWLWFVFFTTQDVIFRKHFFLAVAVLVASEIGLRRTKSAVWLPLLTIGLLVAVGRGRSTHLLIWLYAVPSLVLLGGAWALVNARVRPLVNLLSLSGLSLLALVFLTPLSNVRGEPHVIVASFNVSRYPEGPIRDMAQWAKAHTKPDALFLTPPQDGNFRLSAGRAIVVNFKTFAWGDQGLLDWRQRISDVTGNVPLKLGDGYYLELRDKYNALSPTQIEALQHKYKFDYAIVNESKQLKWPVVFQTHGWKVYKTK